MKYIRKLFISKSNHTSNNFELNCMKEISCDCKVAQVCLISLSSQFRLHMGEGVTTPKTYLDFGIGIEIY